MNYTLGPRTVFFLDDEGHQQAVTINIRLQGTQMVELGDGAHVIEHIGSYEIKSELFNKTMQFSGVDDLQVLYRCIWLSDLWLQTAAKNFGVTLFPTIAEQPVEKPFDVYA